VREASPEQCDRLVDDSGVCRIEKNPKAVRAFQWRDVPVAEVETEQLGIVAGRDQDRPGGTPASRTDRAGLDSHIPRLPPIADRRSRDAEEPADLAVVGADGDERECLLFDRWTVHEHMFANGTDGICAPRPRGEYDLRLREWLDSSEASRNRKPTTTGSRRGMSTPRWSGWCGPIPSRSSPTRTAGYRYASSTSSGSFGRRSSETSPGTSSTERRARRMTRRTRAAHCCGANALIISAPRNGSDQAR
jgi:hypothetical protein